MQAWLAMHEPQRGDFWSKPKVHSGFQRCWLANGFNVRVRQHIDSLFDSGVLEHGKVKVYVTGGTTCLCVWLWYSADA